MLKIYRAFADRGEIKLEDYITFTNGQFDTGLNGFGQVSTGNNLRSVKLEDGYVTDFIIQNPYSYAMLEKNFKDLSKEFDTYEWYGLERRGNFIIYRLYSFRISSR